MSPYEVIGWLTDKGMNVSFRKLDSERMAAQLLHITTNTIGSAVYKADTTEEDVVEILYVLESRVLSKMEEDAEKVTIRCN